MDYLHVQADNQSYNYYVNDSWMSADFYQNPFFSNNAFRNTIRVGAQLLSGRELDSGYMRGSRKFCQRGQKVLSEGPESFVRGSPTLSLFCFCF